MQVNNVYIVLSIFHCCLFNAADVTFATEADFRYFFYVKFGISMKGGSETTPPPHEFPFVFMVFLWIAINTTSMQYITYNSPVTFILLKYSFA